MREGKERGQDSESIWFKFAPLSYYLSIDDYHLYSMMENEIILRYYVMLCFYNVMSYYVMLCYVTMLCHVIMLCYVTMLCHVIMFCYVM